MSIDWILIFFFFDWILITSRSWEHTMSSALLFSVAVAISLEPFAFFRFLLRPDQIKLGKTINKPRNCIMELISCVPKTLICVKKKITSVRERDLKRGKEEEEDGDWWDKICVYRLYIYIYAHTHIRYQYITRNFANLLGVKIKNSI